MTVLDIDEHLIENIEHLPFQTDNGIGTTATLGLLVLQTDQTIEDEFRCALPESGVALYGARLKSPEEITPENLRKMEAELAQTARLLPSISFDVIGFGCTSGSLVIGERKVAERIHEVMPGVKVTDPVTALLAAMKALGAKRIALLTPYIATINHSLRNSLVERGLSVPVMGSFNEADDYKVARITPKDIEKAIVTIGASEHCDAVFVSCTSMRVARIAEATEAKLGKPVTSSNHAMAWHMLRLAGIDTAIPNLGQLYRTPLAE